MKHKILLVICIMCIGTIYFPVYGKGKIVYHVDITKTDEDQLQISIDLPKIKQDTLIFCLPRVIPGTYTVFNFGAYVSDLKVLDKKANEISFTHPDKNIWVIPNSGKISKIVYNIHDTWDTPEIKEEVFEPTGTSFEKGNFYLLNNGGVFGYIKGFENMPCELLIQRPDSLYGSTSLVALKSKSKTLDIFETKNYHQLVDSPIMYCVPDTTTIIVNNTEILISVFSENPEHSSKSIKPTIDELINAQSKYLGGTLPVKKYSFLVAMREIGRNSYGALEHSTSTFMYLPSYQRVKSMNNTIQHIASHEFYHIITPLNLHSKEIGEFDYLDPKMSKHLWLYEGVTEYTAHLSQLKAGTISLENFVQTFRRKIRSANHYRNTTSLTTVSKEILDKDITALDIFYEKGAVMAFCLDIKLLELSKGKYSLHHLMNDLMMKYGSDKSFDDDELFDVITSLTYPEIGEFLAKYIDGIEKLNYSDYFDLIGLTYTEETNNKRKTIKFSIDKENTNALELRNQWMSYQ